MFVQYVYQSELIDVKNISTYSLIATIKQIFLKTNKYYNQATSRYYRVHDIKILTRFQY